MSRAGSVLGFGLAMVLSGCATTGMFAEDASDPCNAQRKELAGAQNYYATAVVQGAALGAIIGGLSGALLGSGSNRGTAAATGAVVGAVAGGLGGYYMAKQKDARDAAQLAASIQNDIVTENTEIDRATIAFTRLRQCRFAVAESVKADFRARRISRDEAIRQLDEQKQRFDADIAGAESIGVKMADKAKEFQYASDELVKSSPEARAELAEEGAVGEPVKKKHVKRHRKHVTPHGKPSAVTVASVTETNQVKQKSFVDEVQGSKKLAQAAFSLEGSVSLLLPNRLICSKA
jgi:outer membrane lipoprotein SlyB